MTAFSMSKLTIFEDDNMATLLQSIFKDNSSFEVSFLE